jgi:hypothetical protein
MALKGAPGNRARSPDKVAGGVEMNRAKSGAERQAGGMSADVRAEGGEA